MFTVNQLSPLWFQHDEKAPQWRQCGHGKLIEAFTINHKNPKGVVRLRVAYGNGNVINAVYNRFKGVYKNCTTGNANSVDFDCKSKDKFDEIFESVRKFLEKNTVLPKRNVTSNRTSDNGYFLKKVATVIHAMDGGDLDVLCRAGMGFDSHDNLMTIGYSVAASSQVAISGDSEGLWREHLVPCCIVVEEARRMAEAGASAPAIAQMLKTNLAIMIITKEEQVTLDSRYKTTMPDGWKFGDSVFARLDAEGVGIRY